jgi:hypothetical protein
MGYRLVVLRAGSKATLPIAQNGEYSRKRIFAISFSAFFIYLFMIKYLDTYPVRKSTGLYER